MSKGRLEIERCKQASGDWATQYLNLLRAEAVLCDRGADTNPSHINLANKIRAELSIADELIRSTLKTMREVSPHIVRDLDQDSDCRG